MRVRIYSRPWRYTWQSQDFNLRIKNFHNKIIYTLPLCLWEHFCFEFFGGGISSFTWQISIILFLLSHNDKLSWLHVSCIIKPYWNLVTTNYYMAVVFVYWPIIFGWQQFFFPHPSCSWFCWLKKFPYTQDRWSCRLQCLISQQGVDIEHKPGPLEFCTHQINQWDSSLNHLK